MTPAEESAKDELEEMAERGQVPDAEEEAEGEDTGPSS